MDSSSMGQQNESPVLKYNLLCTVCCVYAAAVILHTKLNFTTVDSFC